MPNILSRLLLRCRNLSIGGLILAGHDISAGGMITTLLEMCFSNPKGGLEARLDKIPYDDLIKILFAENPGILIQVKHRHLVDKILRDYGVASFIVARPIKRRSPYHSKRRIPQRFRH